MGIIRRPAYYKNFKCIGSDCTDNCCIGWEIDIDSDTLAYYQSVSGSFGERLRQSIELPNGDTDENPHFRIDRTARCPFLNDCNLCDIFIELGEPHLSQICTDHPRFYEWFSNTREDGLGLCCEAAAGLILQKTGYPTWEILEDAEETSTVSEELLTAEQTLFAMREQLFAVIKPEQDCCIDEKLNRLYAEACAMQDTYDRLLFSASEEEESIPNWCDCFMQESFVQALLEGCLSLEINDPKWRDLLLDMQTCLPDILAQRTTFLTYYQDRLYEYDQLLIYFLYRYFMKALEDDYPLGKVKFALYSVSLLQLLDVFHWMRHGTLTEWDQICLCKLYSREMEYDTDNTDYLSDYPLT